MSNLCAEHSAPPPDAAAANVNEAAAIVAETPAQPPPQAPASFDGDAMADPAASHPPAPSSPSASARRCNCKNSRCLKLYCECFAAGSYCNAACKCKCCLNSKRHMPERQAAIKATLERNAFAFQPKISSAASEEQLEDAGRHLKGCNCKKSNCLKKYCECFQAGVVCSPACKCVDCLNFEGDALAAAKCRVPERDRSKPSPKPLKRKSAHATSSSKVLSWDAAFRCARAPSSDASLQLQGRLRRGGSFESKIVGDDLFDAIQQTQAHAVKDAIDMGGSKGLEALLAYLNPLIEAVAERVTREAAAAAAAAVAAACGDGSDGMGGDGTVANGHVKDENDSEHVDGEHDDEDAADDDAADDDDRDDDDEEEGDAAETDEEDNDAGDDSDHSSAASQGQHLAAEAEVDSGKVASSDAVVAAEDDSMGGP